MKAPVSLFPIVIAALMVVACIPSAKLPITGEIKLEFVRKVTSDIHVKLKNQSSKPVSFRGARDWWWDAVFPQVPRFECVVADPAQPYESPYPLIDGPAWEEFVTEPGEEIDIIVGNFFLKDGDRKLPTGRCRFVLQLDGGAVVKSEEFESTTSASQP
jgi:hypothetical protein